MASKRQRTSRANFYKREQAGRIEGPGVFVTCVRGKEKQSVSELYDVFESLAADLWPTDTQEVASFDDTQPADEENLEDEITRELESLKRPRKEKRFSSVHTETACFLFLSCRAPVDPVKLATAYLEEVETTCRARTRFVHRLIPASDTCAANLPEMLLLAQRLLPGTFDTGRSYKYKIELNIINHSKLKKDAIIPPLADLVPKDKGHTVDLKHPEAVILVQIFKTFCGISVVQHWERFRRFNVIQLAEEQNKEEEAGAQPGGPHAADSATPAEPAPETAPGT